MTNVFDLKPKAIIEHMGLRNPIYSLTSCYGHFGNALFAWEQVTRQCSEALREELEHDN